MTRCITTAAGLAGAAALIVGMSMLAGCHTVGGAGRDLQAISGRVLMAIEPTSSTSPSATMGGGRCNE